jgi:hypothetical protein
VRQQEEGKETQYNKVLGKIKVEEAIKTTKEGSSKDNKSPPQ